jgi:hypothetical protein
MQPAGQTPDPPGQGEPQARGKPRLGDPALDHAVEAGQHLAGLIAATIALAKAEAREHLGRLATLVLLLVLGAFAAVAGALVLMVSILAGLVALFDSTALGLLVGALVLVALAGILFVVAQRGFKRFKTFPASREELRRTLALVGRA